MVVARSGASSATPSAIIVAWQNSQLVGWAVLLLLSLQISVKLWNSLPSLVFLNNYVKSLFYKVCFPRRPWTSMRLSEFQLLNIASTVCGLTSCGAGGALAAMARPQGNTDRCG